MRSITQVCSKHKFKCRISSPIPIALCLTRVPIEQEASYDTDSELEYEANEDGGRTHILRGDRSGASSGSSEAGGVGSAGEAAIDSDDEEDAEAVVYAALRHRALSSGREQTSDGVACCPHVFASAPALQLSSSLSNGVPLSTTTVALSRTSMIHIGGHDAASCQLGTVTMALQLVPTDLACRLWLTRAVRQVATNGAMESTSTFRGPCVSQVACTGHQQLQMAPCLQQPQVLMP